MKVAERTIFAAGMTILVVFLCSWALLLSSPYHTGRRELAIAFSQIASILVLLWLPIAVILALRCWHTTTIKLRILLALNIAVATLLIANFVRFR